jgi:hypothetical protein
LLKSEIPFSERARLLRNRQTQGEEEAMKFFTADLLERFGSDHDHIALAAQSQLEQRAEEYSRNLGEVELELPQRFRELLDRYYLHDAQVMEHSRLGNVENLSIADPELGACSTRWKPVEQIDGRLLSFWIVLALDTPPRDVVVLQYRSVLIDGADTHQSLREDGCPYLEWQYDEVELVETGRGKEFRHSILFSNGLELRLRFKDFDFTTLKPIESMSELAEADH